MKKKKTEIFLDYFDNTKLLIAFYCAINPTQANNLWIFPAVGMAVYATQSKRVTDKMFLVAAQELSQQLTAQHIKQI